MIRVRLLSGTRSCTLGVDGSFSLTRAEATQSPSVCHCSCISSTTAHRLVRRAVKCLDHPVATDRGASCCFLINQLHHGEFQSQDRCCSIHTFVRQHSGNQQGRKAAEQTCYCSSSGLTTLANTQAQQGDCTARAVATAKVMAAAGVPVGFFRAHVTLKVRGQQVTITVLLQHPSSPTLHRCISKLIATTNALHISAAAGCSNDCGDIQQHLPDPCLSICA